MCTGYRVSTEQELTLTVGEAVGEGRFAEDVMPGQILKHK